jgi:hypothetical protein
MSAQRIVEGLPARRTILVAAALFFGAHALYWSSPNHGMADSQYTLLLSDNLLEHRDIWLERYQLPENYRILHSDGHDHYFYPPGSSVLSLPYVAAMRARHLSVVRSNGSYNEAVESYMNLRLACFVASLFVMLAFLTAHLVLPLGWSVAVAIVAGFGTQIYSTASRSLGADTWGTLVVGLAAYLLLRAESQRREPEPVALGSLAAWAYIVRPTNSLTVVALTAYFALWHRRLLPRLLGAAAFWLALLVCYSLIHFGHLLPLYFRLPVLGGGSFFVSLFGHLLSPSRGFLVYVPVVVVIAWMAVAYRHHLRFPRLAALAAAVPVVHLVVIAYYRSWGGHSFGPRLFTGTIPWLVLLAVLSLDAVRAAPRRAGRPVLLGAAVLASVLSVAINTVLATRHEAADWNVTPVNVDAQPDRIWRWREAQFLVPFIDNSGPIRPLPPGGLQLGSPEADGYLVAAGWSLPEVDSRWTDGHAADVRFAIDGDAPGNLAIELRPYLARKLVRQRVELSLNGHPLEAFDLDRPGFSRHLVAVPSAFRARENTLRFDLPDAAAPRSVEQSSDGRRLGVSVRSIRWEADPPR